jgi:hypothetical protein
VKTNNLFYSGQSQVEIQTKEQEPSTSSAIVSASEEVSPLQQPNSKNKSNTRNSIAFTVVKLIQAIRSVLSILGIKHPGKMFWPTPEDFEKRL